MLTSLPSIPNQLWEGLPLWCPFTAGGSLCFPRHRSVNNSHPRLGSILLYLTSYLSFRPCYLPCLGSSRTLHCFLRKVSFSLWRYQPPRRSHTSWLLIVWESANKYPERLLFAIDFSCCLTPEIFFLCGTTTLCLLTNWTGRCALVYLAPDISIAPNNQIPPIPLIHNWPKQAIQFIPLLISSGIAAEIKTESTGLTTSLIYYQSLSKDLNGGLQEVAASLITLQGRLDSLAAVVLQNRRGLDLLTAEKEAYVFF